MRDCVGHYKIDDWCEFCSVKHDCIRMAKYTSQESKSERGNSRDTNDSRDNMDSDKNSKKRP